MKVCGLSSQGAKSQRRGGGVVQNDTFHISRAPAPKPDIVPSSCNIHVDKCSMKVCGKSHQD